MMLRLCVVCIDTGKLSLVTSIDWSAMAQWRGRYTIDRYPNKECQVSRVCVCVCVCVRVRACVQYLSSSHF